MAISSDYKEKVISQLSKIGPIRSKNMFGGVGLYYDEDFFGLIDDDATYLKVDETNIEDYKSMDMSPWGFSKGYYRLPESILEDAEKLKAWVEKAVTVSSKNKARVP